jgi:hypothetical protein
LALEKFQCLVALEKFQCLVALEKFQSLVALEKFQCLVAREGEGEASNYNLICEEVETSKLIPYCLLFIPILNTI